MKKKTIFSLLLAAGVALLATSSMASSVKMKQLLSSASASGDVIHTLTLLTPNNEEINLAEVVILAGTSTSCDVLTSVVSFESSGEGDLVAVSGVSGLTSDDIVADLGPGLGCFEMDVYPPGAALNPYTTGPIVLTWNADTKQYTAANPSLSTINFSPTP